MPDLDTHPYRVWMLQYAAFHGLAHEDGFDPSLHGPLGVPGRNFLNRIQKHMVASKKFPHVKVTGILDGPTRDALAPNRPGWQGEFTRIARQDAANPTAAYYTQGAARWQGVSAVYGKVKVTSVIPRLRSGDCSAGYTRWVLWGLEQHLGRVPHDVVNGASWKAGYTGTIAAVCKRVTEPQIGDAILYGSAPSFEHVTGVIDVNKRLCVSHGGDNGPIVEPWDYRSDRVGFWRPVISKA
jgi:hypothetical protein